jgi:hypothetical protein
MMRAAMLAVITLGAAMQCAKHAADCSLYAIDNELVGKGTAGSL